MRPRLAAFLFALAVAPLALVAGCQPTTSPELPTNGLKPLLKMPVPRYKTGAATSTEQEVVFKALTQSREQYQAATANLKADSQPGDVAAAFEAYSGALDAIDAKGSPLEFKGAWNRYLKSVKVAQKAIAGVPNIYEDVEFMELLQAVFAGNAEKGKPLGGEVATAVAALLKQHTQLYSVASTEVGVAADSAPK